jgi:uncharacterized protein
MRKESHFKALVLALLLGAVILSTPLAAEKVEEVINPRRLSNSFVSDGAGVLGPEYVRLIDAICRDLQAKTTIELAVVTVGNFGGTTSEDFAEKLFRRFGIGAAGKDNGLLLLCSSDDRAVRIEVGYGLESTITDAKASSLLDTNGVPYLRNGLFGRGLFLTARELAKKAAASAGVVLYSADPNPWPEQVQPPAPAAQPKPKKKKGWDPLASSLLFAAGLLALGLLGIFWTLFRLKRARALAERQKVIGGGTAFIILTWVLAVIGFFVLLGFSGEFLLPLAAMLATPAAATAGQLFTGSFLKRRLSSYRLPCRACDQPMEMVADSEDEQFLTTEEAAEEKAGGMDYEFWRCPNCKAEERLEVKLGKAAACPKCKRRTLTSSTTTLVAATSSQGGKERVTEKCLNPKCGYSNVSERSTARLAPAGSTSSRSGSSSSSSGSFGGGRSGGGGASKRF